MSLLELETTRLRLSNSTTWDCWDLSRLAQLPDVRTPPDETEPVPLEVIMDSINHFSRPGGLRWVIRFKRSKWAIGWASVDRGPTGTDSTARLMITILPAARRSGYGVEAAAAVIEHAFRDDRLSAIAADVDPPSGGCTEFLKRLGFVQQPVEETLRTTFVLDRHVPCLAEEAQWSR